MKKFFWYVAAVLSLAALLAACDTPLESGVSDGAPVTEPPVKKDLGIEYTQQGFYIGSSTEPVKGVEGLSGALAWINTKAEDGGSYTLVFDNDDAVAPTSLSYPGKEVTITLKGLDKVPKLYLDTTGSKGPMFALTGTKTNPIAGKMVRLVLDNVALVGASNNNDALVRIGEYAGLELKEGAEIRDNVHNQPPLERDVKGGGVYLFGEGSPAELILNGGKISGNKVLATHGEGSGFATFARSNGGGVYMQDGSFIMNSGEISGNYVYATGANESGVSSAEGGGVDALSPYQFTIKGGKISGNMVKTDGGQAQGGGVVVTFIDKAAPDGWTMSGGEISGNIVESDEKAQGGGVVVDQRTRFTMTGGSIYGNKTVSAAASYGGGVYISRSSGKFIKTGGNVGANNSAASGKVLFSPTSEVVDKDPVTLETELTGSFSIGLNSGEVRSDGKVRLAGFNATITITNNEIPYYKDTKQQNWKINPTDTNWSLRYNGVYLRIKTRIDGNYYSQFEPAYYNESTGKWELKTDAWPVFIGPKDEPISFVIFVYDNKILGAGGMEYTIEATETLTVTPEMATTAPSVNFSYAAK